jgi:hypothetical protein
MEENRGCIALKSHRSEHKLRNAMPRTTAQKHAKNVGRKSVRKEHKSEINILREPV